MSAFAAVIAQAQQAIRNAAGVPITYSRGAAQVDVTAVVGRSEWELTDARGFITKTERRDYLIPSSQLVLSGGRIEPKAGDRIRETFADRIETFEVMGPGQGQPDWRYSDPGRTTYRVHTKHIATEPLT